MPGAVLCGILMCLSLPASVHENAPYPVYATLGNARYDALRRGTPPQARRVRPAWRIVVRVRDPYLDGDNPYRSGVPSGISFLNTMFHELAPGAGYDHETLRVGLARYLGGGVSLVGVLGRAWKPDALPFAGRNMHPRGFGYVIGFEFTLGPQ